jgi:hypothetical protein
VNLRLFLRFEQMEVKNRKLNKLASGVVTFGSAPPPITLYEGPTGRREVKGPASLEDTGPCSSQTPLSPAPLDPGREGSSLGNVRRGEPRCTFVNEITGLPLVLSIFPKVFTFPGDAVLKLVEPSLYRKGLRILRGTEEN